MQDISWLVALQIAAAATNLIVALVLGHQLRRNARAHAGSRSVDVRLGFHSAFSSLHRKLTSGAMEASAAQSALESMIGEAGILFGDNVAALMREYATHAARYAKNTPEDLFTTGGPEAKVAQRRRSVAAKNMTEMYGKIVEGIAHAS